MLLVIVNLSDLGVNLICVLIRSFFYVFITRYQCFCYVKIIFCT